MFKIQIRTFRFKALTAGFFIIALVLAGLLYAISVNGRPRAAAASILLGPPPLWALIDPGHGGLDGGAVSANNIPEAGINLAISEKMQALFGFFGVSARLTRTDESSLDFDPEKSIKGNKNADLHARFDLAQEYPESDFLSVHLNKFGKSQFHGAQVFYSSNCDESKLLAESLQESMCQVLDPENARRAKMAPDSIFLMKSILTPAVTIECGFLSNPREEQLLQENGYQVKIALSITQGYFNYRQALAVSGRGQQ